MILLIDIGNSQLKWLSYDGKQLSSLSRYPYKQDLSLDQCFHDVKSTPEQIYFISVASAAINEVLAQYCMLRWGIEAKRLVTGRECCGVTNGYKQPESLGVDRWVAMVGAYRQYQSSVAVFDFGTASTLDVLDSHGVHRGGAIIPGLDMMRQCLVAGTTQITGSEQIAHTTSFGLTTADCIEYGTKEASAAFIERMEAQARQLVGEPLTVVISGGAGRELVDIISSEAVYEEKLVFLGMVEMLKSFRDGDSR